MEHGAWEALKVIAADPSLNAQRPNVGKTVRVIEGKRLGTEGVVTWHGPDRFSPAFRYCDEMTARLRDLKGRWGFRVRIAPADGSEPFFIAAEKVCAL